MTSLRNQTNADAFNRVLSQDMDILEGLDINPIGRFSVPDSEDPRSLRTADISVTEVRCIGSYNWLETDLNTPTIVVPGSPPLWGPPTLPHAIHFPDQGIHIIDQGGFRMSSTGISTLLPLICAVNKCAEQNAESFEWSSVDIVTDRSALRKLLRWANGKASATRMNRQSDGNFRIDLEMAGEGTLLMSRVPLRVADRLEGYRRGFERAFTSEPDLDGEALDHYCVVTYDLGGMKMVVRFEVDAFMPDAQHSSQRVPACADSDAVDHLSNALASATIANQIATEPTMYHGVTVMEGGRQVPQSTIIEFKTQSHRRGRPEWTEGYTQTFLSQTDSLIWARHDRGQFSSLQRIQRTSLELRNVEQEAQIQLGKLFDVLLTAGDLFVQHGERAKLSLVCVDGILTVYRRDGPDSFLPDEVLDLFNGDADGEGENQVEM